MKSNLIRLTLLPVALFASAAAIQYVVRPKNFLEAYPFTDAELAEWQTLWRGLLAMAKERGIETYMLNWNIFVSPEFARAHNVARWSENWRHFGSAAETNEIVVG